MRARSASQRAVSVGRHAPGVELQLAARRARLGERRVRALLARQLARGSRARGSRSPRRSAATARAPRAQSNGRRSWKNTSCRPITPRPTGRQRRFDALRRRDRVVVEVDHAIELAHGRCAPCARACRSRTRRRRRRRGAPRLIEPRLQTAVSSPRRDLEDLGAQVRQVHDAARAAPVWLQARLRLVLERHPAVAGLRRACASCARRARAP